MKYKQRLFIYDRREITTLIALAVMLSVFCFTLGIHLGKRAGTRTLNAESTETSTVTTVGDTLPNQQELSEQAKGSDQTAEETLNQDLHDAVLRSGIKLDTRHQVDLPEKPKRPNAGATTLQNEHRRE